MCFLYGSLHDPIVVKSLNMKCDHFISQKIICEIFDPEVSYIGWDVLDMHESVCLFLSTRVIDSTTRRHCDELAYDQSIWM